MNRKCSYFYLCCGISLLSALALAVSTALLPLTEREAKSSRNPTEPQALARVLTWIPEVFDVSLSLEGIPEESGYEDPSGSEDEVPPFPIQAGETFGNVMKRFVAASDNVYTFEVIRGTPILRPNPEIVKTPNLLDTVVDLEIEDSTIWDALCELARTVNRKNWGKGAKSFYIHLQGPEFVELPAPVFLEQSKVSVELTNVSAREAMCAIMESAEQRFTYYHYFWPSGFTYVSVVAKNGEGRVMKGPRVRDPKKLDKWSDENIANLQSAKINRAGSGTRRVLGAGIAVTTPLTQRNSFLSLWLIGYITAVVSNSTLENRLPVRQFISEEPMTLLDRWRAVTDSFEMPISLEPLPEHCLDADTKEELLPPIEITENDSFAKVIEALEEASGFRWEFVEIQKNQRLRKISGKSGTQGIRGIDLYPFDDVSRFSVARRDDVDLILKLGSYTAWTDAPSWPNPLRQR